MCRQCTCVSKLFLPLISTEHKEWSSVSRQMVSKSYSTLSEEQPEMDEGRGLFDAMMQPVVKLNRIGR